QDRTPPGAFVTTGTAGSGVPYEDMIELANESHKDMWINIPALATADYIQNMAQLIHTKLDPSLKVYVEYSDETWNGAYAVHNQVLAAAKTNPLVTSTDPLTMILQQSAYELVSVSRIFHQVFGSQSTRVLPILGGWDSF